MSIVIPASDLTRTVITIRCDSPHAAPQVECALDEQALLQHKNQQQSQQHQPLLSPIDTACNYSTLTRSSSSSSLAMDSPRTPMEMFSSASVAPGQRTDLNVERGLDQRGHYVRLCFLSAMQRSQSEPGVAFFNQDTGSYFPPALETGVAHNEIYTPAGASVPSAFSMDMNTDIPSLMGNLSRPFGASMNLEHTFESAAHVDIDNMAFAFSEDGQLMSALDSFMNGFDFPQTWGDFDMSSAGAALSEAVPSTPAATPASQLDRHQQHLMPTSQLSSEPGSPEMPSPASSLSSSSCAFSSSPSSSSSASSGTSSPATPYHFFTPTSTPTNELAVSPGGLFNFGPSVGVGPDTAFQEARGSASATQALFNPSDIARSHNGPMSISAPGLGLGAVEKPSVVPSNVSIASAADAYARSHTHSPSHSHSQSPFQTHPLSQSQLPSHTQLQSQTQPVPRLLPCPQQGCRRQFKSTSTLSGHLKTHAGKGARFACSFAPCAEKFSRRHDQLRHEVYKHGKRCEWVCPRCSSFFSYERSLEKHTCTMDKSRRGSAPYAAAAGVAGSTDEAPGTPPKPSPASLASSPTRANGAGAAGAAR